ncbi:MAG: hypothetical protein KGZ25_15630, partial [Planctomycetes bacterium]|nr:hypothetical protein [Planctomycetota bacterium]
GEEAWRTDIETRKVEKISWPSHCWHAYSSREANYIVADSNEKFYRGCPSTVGFLNRSTGQYIELVRNPEMKGVTGSEYHIDPHPRFCSNDRYVVFTTTIRGSVELAIAETEDLIDRTC